MSVLNDKRTAFLSQIQFFRIVIDEASGEFTTVFSTPLDKIKVLNGKALLMSYLNSILSTKDFKGIRYSLLTSKLGEGEFSWTAKLRQDASQQLYLRFITHRFGSKQHLSGIYYLHPHADKSSHQPKFLQNICKIKAILSFQYQDFLLLAENPLSAQFLDENTLFLKETLKSLKKLPLLKAETFFYRQLIRVEQKKYLLFIAKPKNSHKTRIECLNISAMTALEEALINAKSKLLAIIENTNDAIFLLNRKFEVEGFNDSFEQYLGYFVSTKPQIGMSIQRILQGFEAHTQVQFREHLNKALLGIRFSEYYTFELSGQSIHYEFFFNPVFSDGEVIYISILGRDVTKNRTAYQKTKENEKLLNKIQQIGKVAGFDFDFNSSSFVWTNGFRHIFPFYQQATPKNLTNFTQLFDPNEEEKIKQFFRHLMQNGNGKLELKNTNGPLGNHYYCLHAAYDSGKKLLTGFLQDISDEKKTRLKLEKNEASFAEAQRIAQLGSFEIHPETRIWKTSVQFRKCLGIESDEEYLPESAIMAYLKSAKPLQKLQHRLAACIEEGIPFLCDLEYQPPNFLNQKWFSFSGKQFKNDASETVKIIGIVQDISERKESENELKNLNQFLLEKSRLLEESNEELEKFAYIASHDLQEPLRMVNSFMQLLEDHYKDQLDEKAQKYIYFAMDGAVRMSHLIHDLIEFSRVGRINTEFSNCDLNLVFDEVKKDLMPQLEEHQVQLLCERELPIVRGQRQSLKQLFQNIIGNAIKYKSDERPPIISIRYQERPKEFIFEIEDNGIGIREKFYEKIFMIFQRLHRQNEYSGTGIGLAICKKIVDMHGGLIWVDSVPEQGSTFYFSLKKQIS